MATRGRQSAASLAIAAPAGIDRRLAPPGELTAPQKAEWVAVVNARPADWFGPENASMLAQYCRHKVQADLVAQQLEAFNPLWLLEDDGLKRYDKLTMLQERETRTINALLRSMRLTQQSMVRADKAIDAPKGRRPWLGSE